MYFFLFLNDPLRLRYLLLLTPLLIYFNRRPLSLNLIWQSECILDLNNLIIYEQIAKCPHNIWLCAAFLPYRRGLLKLSKNVFEFETWLLVILLVLMLELLEYMLFETLILLCG